MRKFMIFIIILTVKLSLAKNHNFQTLTYFRNDSLKLDLDLFLPDNTNIDNSTPLVIFAHGGGFKGGNRTVAHDLCDFLSENGIAAATITYSLYMKETDQSFSCDGIVTEKIRAIQIASNQFWQATQFFIDNHSEYNIDIKKIFIAGSSAGAETIYGAAYWDPEIMGIYPVNLPADFKYGGFIAGAGAIVDINLITKETMVPSLLFHGTCDNIVPYYIAPHHYCKGNVPGWLMLFGNYAVHERISSLNGKSFMVSYCGGKHNYSWVPFNIERDKILWFIENATKDKTFQLHEVVPTGNDCELSSEYDYCN